MGVQFSTNLRKSSWAPQGTPRNPQGIPKGAPRDPQGSPPRGPRAAQREPSGRQNQAKDIPKPFQGQPKQAKRTNYISTNSRSTACAAVMLILYYHLILLSYSIMMLLYNYILVFFYYHIVFFRSCFCWEKNRRRPLPTGLTQGAFHKYILFFLIHMHYYFVRRLLP